MRKPNLEIGFLNYTKVGELMGAADIMVKIEAFTKGFDQAISQAETSLNNLKKTGQGAGSEAQKWGSRFSSAGKALLPASLATGALTTSTAKLGSEYTAQMGKVQAISGATSKEMMLLKKAGLDATKGTKFTAIEAGEAYEYMGMAGWKSGQMISGLKPILNLATAAGADLGTTSDIVTDALTAFGLKANDAGMFADVLAAASTNSNTTVEMMGETFKYAAPIAGALGYSVKDTAIAIGLMANAGIKGSQAGTSLRTALTNMASPTKEASDMMAKLGIHTKDSNGNMLPLRDLIGQLRSKFKGLSKEQQTQAAETMFGKEAMSGMLAIINASDEDYGKLTSSIDNSSGAAEKMSKTMSDSDPIATAVASIKNSFISAGEVIMPFIAKLAKGISNLAKWFQDLPSSVKGFLVAVAAIVTVAAPLLMFLGSIFSGIAGLQAILLATGPAAAGASVGILSIVGPILAVIGVIAAVIAIGVLLYKNWDKIKAKASEIGEGIKKAWDGVKTFFANLWTGIKTGFSNFFTSIRDGFKSLWTNISTGFTSFIGSIGTFFANLPAKIATGLQTVIDGIITWGANLITAVATLGTQFVTNFVNFFTELPYKIGYALGFLLGAVINGLKTIFDTAIEWGPKIVEGIVNFFKELPGKISTFLTESWDKVKEWGNNLATSASEIAKNFIINVETFFKELPGKVSNFLTESWNKAREWGNNMMRSATEAGTNFISAVIKFFRQLPGKIYSFLRDCLVKVSSFVVDLAGKGRDAAGRFFNNIVNGIKNLPRKLMALGEDIVKGLWNGIKGAAGWLYDKVAGFAQGIIDGFMESLGIGSPSKKMRDEVGRWIPAGIAVGIDSASNSVLSSMEGLSSMTIDSIAGVSDIDYSNLAGYPQLNQDIATFSEKENTAPVSFKLNLGGRRFKAFVDDISKVQNQEIDLIEEYGI